MPVLSFSKKLYTLELQLV